LLDHDGHLSRRYEEIKCMGTEIKAAGEQIYGSTVKSAVAMMLSYDSRFAFQIQANNPQFSYPAHFHQFYRALYHHNVPIDVVAPTDDLSAYRLVIVPALHVVSTAIAENLNRFVAAGGVLVVTQRSGVKDEANAVVNQRLPGLLAGLCGVEVEEYDSLGTEMHNELEFVLPGLPSDRLVPVNTWCDVLRPTGATVVACYTKDYYAGKPAVTMNQFGQGRAVYVGAYANAPLYEALAGWLLGLADVQPLLSVPEGIEVTERWQGERRLLFLLNHTKQEREISLDRRYTNLIGGSEALEGTVTVPPRGILVLQED
jgi:beta-galactosidase